MFVINNSNDLYIEFADLESSSPGKVGAENYTKAGTQSFFLITLWSRILVHVIVRRL